MAEESGRPGTVRSNVGCEAIEEPWTKRMQPMGRVPAAGRLFQRKSFTSPLRVQCSVPPAHVLVEPSAMRISPEKFAPVVACQCISAVRGERN